MSKKVNYVKNQFKLISYNGYKSSPYFSDLTFAGALCQCHSSWHFYKLQMKADYFRKTARNFDAQLFQHS